MDKSFKKIFLIFISAITSLACIGIFVITIIGLISIILNQGINFENPLELRDSIFMPLITLIVSYSIGLPFIKFLIPKSSSISGIRKTSLWLAIFLLSGIIYFIVNLFIKEKDEIIQSIKLLAIMIPVGLTYLLTWFFLRENKKN